MCLDNAQRHIRCLPSMNLIKLVLICNYSDKPTEDFKIIFSPLIKKKEERSVLNIGFVRKLCCCSLQGPVRNGPQGLTLLRCVLIKNVCSSTASRGCAQQGSALDNKLINHSLPWYSNIMLYYTRVHMTDRSCVLYFWSQC